MEKIEVIMGGTPVGQREPCLSQERLRTWKFLEKPEALGYLRNIYVTKHGLAILGWEPGDEIKVTVEVIK